MQRALLSRREALPRQGSAWLLPGSSLAVTLQNYWVTTAKRIRERFWVPTLVSGILGPRCCFSSAMFGGSTPSTAQAANFLLK